MLTPDKIEQIVKQVLETNNDGESLDKKLVQAGADGLLKELQETTDYD